MKKSLLSFTLLLLTLVIVSPDASAQRDAGGSSNGFISQPCPVSFKRNNGNGWGVCHGDAQIRVAFSAMPDEIPKLTAIRYTPSNTGVQQTITTVILPVDGDIISKNKPYISYCLTGSLPAPGNSQGNIPPAVKLVLEFTYSTGQVCVTDYEE